MKKNLVFIDGSAGTTGLQVSARLSQRSDIRLISLAETDRKSEEKRASAMQEADVAILCLPDSAAMQAAAMVAGMDVRIIDASSAHRTADGWVYGFPELRPDQTQKIAEANLVSNPGCYASGFLALSHPLIENGLIAPDQTLITPAVSGYSGGGKNMIASMKKGILPPHFDYSLGLSHKHIPEMMKHSGLRVAPLFMPSVGMFEQGMLVRLAIPAADFSKNVTIHDIHEIYQEAYHYHPMIRVCGLDEASSLQHSGQLSADGVAGQDGLEIFCFNNPETQQFLIIARLDNLGKGAAGAAVQNLNIMLGCSPNTGLNWDY
ncbi:MAG: N-acetyl-gamma-glutamyl-phosphate reductase [Alphaproteobacteria bacterium]